jgi:flagellar hook-basal body complex protein FliE
MNLNSVEKLAPVKLLSSSSQSDANFYEDFSKMLSDAVSSANQKEIKAESMIKQLTTGKISNLHDVLIAMEEANLSLQLTLEVRNRIVEAYQEIMRMTV